MAENTPRIETEFSFKEQVGFGNYGQRHRAVRVKGYNADIDVAAGETVWSAGAGYVFNTIAETLSVVSTDAADALAGLGAQTVTIEGLDANYVEISETVDMDGLTPVVTSASFLRVNKMYVASVGTDEGNDGDISATSSGEGNVLGFIATGEGESEACIYTVPNGYDGFMVSSFIGVVDGTNSQANLCILVTAEDRTNKCIDKLLSATGQSERKYELMIKVDSKSDIEIFGTVTANNSQVAAGFEMILMAD